MRSATGTCLAHFVLGADSLVHQQGQQLRDWLLQWKQRSAPLAVLETPPARLPRLIASQGSPVAECAVLLALVAGARLGIIELT
jgi:hypothetical protein